MLRRKVIALPPVTAKYPFTDDSFMQRSICRSCSHTITDLYGDWFHYSDAAGSRTACAVCGCARAMPTRKSGRKAQWTDEQPVPQAKKQFAAVRQNGAQHEFRPEINYLARAYTKYVHRVLAGSMPPGERFRMLDAADWPRRMKVRATKRKDARRIFVSRRRRTQ